MYFTDEKIHEIIRNNCGSPPERVKVEYHIELNRWKYKFAFNARVKCNDYENTLDTLNRLIVAGEELLKTMEY